LVVLSLGFIKHSTFIQKYQVVTTSIPKSTSRQSAFSVFFLIAAICLTSCSQKNEQEVNNTASQDSITHPKVTLLANLPDSLKPKQTFLDSVAKPLTVAIPTKAGGSYTIQTESGPIAIKLEPSAVHYLIDTITHLPINPEAQGLANFTTFTTDNGLALDAIACGLNDKSGNLWFGTFGGGVSKYDGQSFTTFSTSQGLACNSVLSITEDKTGNLWFGTQSGGVSKYDGKSFTTFSTSQGLVSNTVACITEDKAGNLWFGTYGGVSKYNPSTSLGTGSKSFTTFSTSDGLANNVVYSITEDNTGNLWFGTYGGVSKYNPSTSLGAGSKSFTTFSTSDGLANNVVYRITQDNTGNLWFGTYGGGVSKYDGKSFTTFSTSDGLASNFIRSITLDNAGNLWFGTDGRGVSKYDPSTSLTAGSKSFTTFSTSNGLANNAVWSITQDRTGNLWFGTDGGGVSKYEGQSFTTFSTSQGLANNSVYCITQDRKGNLWFGTYGKGVSKYDGQSFTTFSASQGLASNSVLSITEDKTGNLWFGTYGGGVSRYDGRSFTTFSTSQGLANNVVFSILQDKTGNLWFGTGDGGVSKYDGQSFTTFSTSQGLASNSVSSITEDKTGNLWFGTDGGGVSKYDPSTSLTAGSKSFTTFSTSQGLANNFIRSIMQDNAGNLWFGTQGGGISLLSKEKLVKISASGEVDHNEQGKDRYLQLFENFTTTDGLPDNTVTQIVESDDGKIYVGTNSGICELLPSPSEKGWIVGQTYNSATGDPIKDVNVGQNAMFKDSKGIIWIATGAAKTALVRFEPKAILVNKIPPHLVLKGVKINNENICWMNLQNQGATRNDSMALLLAQFNAFGKPVGQEILDGQKNKFGDIKFDSITKWYPLPENLVLPNAHNSITFDFGSIETDRNILLRYQYILEGYDKEWSSVTDKTSATFGNMFEGTYTFKVIVRNSEGVWGKPVTYTFKVLPPWWRVWWMYALYVLLAVSMIGGYTKWRENVLKKENVILENKIAIATKVIREEKEKVEEQKKVVEEQKKIGDVEKKRSDDLLLNILPSEVAEELKAKGNTTAKDFSKVTVLFTDFKDFTLMSERMTAQELVNEINYCYSAFDNIITKHGIEKIKTIGDSYMCAGGLPVANTTNAEDTVRAALEIRDFMEEEKQKRIASNLPFFEIRIGCNTGPVVAGIVGVKKFAYDIWGNTVNIASRMESSGEPGKVNISGSTYELVKDKFTCTHRGKMEAKNKGMVDMYFVSRF